MDQKQWETTINVKNMTRPLDTKGGDTNSVNSFYTYKAILQKSHTQLEQCCVR